MKSIWIVLLCLSGTSASFGQFFQNNKSAASIFRTTLNQQVPTLDFSVAFTEKSGNSFYVYNEATGLNDSFNKYRDTYAYGKSALVLSNQFRNIKIDSFNPYGVDNPASAILIGVINTLFN